MEAEAKAALATVKAAERVHVAEEKTAADEAERGRLAEEKAAAQKAAEDKRLADETAAAAKEKARLEAEAAKAKAAAKEEKRKRVEQENAEAEAKAAAAEEVAKTAEAERARKVAAASKRKEMANRRSAELDAASKAELETVDATQSKAAPAAASGGSQPAEDSGKESQPCGNFRRNLAGTFFDSCKCSWRKADHPNEGANAEERKAAANARYKFERLLGRGSFGSVELVFDTTKKILRAKKIGRGEKTHGDAGMYMKEALTMAKITHPNTVQCDDCFVVQDDKYKLWHFNIIMEFCAGGDLQGRINRANETTGPFVEDDVLHVLHSCLKGLAHMHKQETIHRDIKPANIMLVKDAPIRDTVVKIADFGLAKVIELKSQAAMTMSMESVSGRVGTEMFMAPEVSRGGKYKASVDV